MSERINSYLRNKRGAITPLVIMSVFILLVIFYVWLQLYIPVAQTFIFPILVNVPMGNLVQLLIEYIPLSLAILIFAYAISASGLMKENRVRQ